MFKYLSFCCFSILLVENFDQNMCDAAQVSATNGIDMVVQNWFPSHIVFNESCVLEGCPELSNFTLCPNDVDENRLYSFFKLVSSCQKRNMCGIVIHKRPVLFVNVSADELLSNSSITGSLSTIPGKGHITNISNIQVELLPGQSGRLPLRMIYVAPAMRAVGPIQVQLTLRTPIFGQNIAINLSNAYYDATYKFVSTVSLNSSSGASTFQIEFLNPVIKASLAFGGLDMPAGYPNIVDLINDVTTFHMEKSKFATAKATLLQKLYQSALDIVSKHC